MKEERDIQRRGREAEREGGCEVDVKMLLTV